MNKLEQYISENYPSNPIWFESEVKQPYHITRVSRVLKNQNYLRGLHDIVNKPDVVHKGVEFNTSKMILQTIKTIINFHVTFVVGRPVNLVGSKDMSSKYNGIYRKGKYHKTNYSIMNNVVKYGDVYEYVYYDKGVIRSRLIDSADGYPIYNSAMEYVGFIEYYTDSVSNISSYTIFSDDGVEVWTNEGGHFRLINTYKNISGLPVHYKNSDEMFGQSILDDIKPILDKIEVVVNRLDDAVYTLSMNPVGVMSGQSLSGSADAEGIGFVLNLEDGGQFTWAVAQLDYNSTKLLLDTLFNQLFMIAQVPSIVMGQSNVANVSEVSLKLLFSLAHNKGIENSIYLKAGFDERNEAIERILKLNGVTFKDEDYVEVEINFNRPSDDAELIDMLSTQFKDGALSKQTYIEKSSIVSDATQEMERLSSEGNDNSVVE
jgi:Phage portal protein, SPP1 Gp6-like.